MTDTIRERVIDVIHDVEADVARYRNRWFGNAEQVRAQVRDEINPAELPTYSSVPDNVSGHPEPPYIPESTPAVAEEETETETEPEGKDPADDTAGDEDTADAAVAHAQAQHGQGRRDRVAKQGATLVPPKP